MNLKHTAAAGAATLTMAASGLALGAQPASAATTTWGTASYGLSCTYDLDTAARTVDGTCTGRTPLGTATATFAGNISGDFAYGTITVDTWFGDFAGNFAGTGWSTGKASGAYRIYTPYGAFTGSFGAAG